MIEKMIDAAARAKANIIIINMRANSLKISVQEEEHLYNSITLHKEAEIMLKAAFKELPKPRKYIDNSNELYQQLLDFAGEE